MPNESGDAGRRWFDVGAAAELAGRPLQPVSAGRVPIALVHRDGRFTAISGACNHVGGPLGEGTLDGEYVVCPWHSWKFHGATGQGKPGYEQDAVPTHAVRVESGRVLVDAQPATPRRKHPHPPHPLDTIVRRGEPGGPPLDAPLRVLGISTTGMDVANPRFSTSDALLDAALARAAMLGAEPRSIRLRELRFRHCEGYYSKSAQACTWPCSITQMDPDDQLDRVYEGVVSWADVILVATPIRWGNASSLYYKMVERMNCIQNQETIADRILLRNKVVGLIVTGGQDNIQAVVGQMMTFFGELGCQFPPFPFIAHSRGWSAEDMERNVAYVKMSQDLHDGACALVERCLDTCRALLGIRIGSEKPVRGGRKAHRLDVRAETLAVIGFGDFELDEERRELRRAGAAVAIQPKVLDLLVFLIRHRDRVVSQAEVLRALWPDAIVTSASLARALKEARRALGDDGSVQRWIRTHRGGGYRFVGAVEEEQRPDPRDGGAADYVGRATLLAALDTALVRAASGTGEIALLVGPAGIGKTRTAGELARQAERRGARVAWARCAGAEYAPPFWPLRRLVAALEDRGRAAEAIASGDRFRIFQTIADAIGLAAARGPLVLMVDDLHEADAGSAALLSFLAPELRELPVLVCATYRSDALERRPDLARERARLLRFDEVVEHELAPLDASELSRFVSLRAGSTPPASVVSALLGATQGNPLWIQEVLRGGMLGAADAVDLDWQRLVSRGFEQVLRERLARLSPEVRSVLEAAAVIGEEFDAELVAVAAKCEVDDALAEARREGLLLASEPDLARHRFAHTVFREALADAMTEPVRAELHARTARALEAREPDERSVEAIARHWLAAGARGDPARAVECAHRAGLRALAVQGWTSAARLFERAVALAEREGVASPETRCDLLLRLAEARLRSGDRDGLRSAAERAIALADAHGWAGRRAEATLLWAGPPFQYRRPDAAISARLGAALGGLVAEQLPLSARLLARRAAEHVLDPDALCAAELRRQAVDAALSCGDAEVLAEVLMTPYSGIWEHVAPARRLALADACVERARAQGNGIAELRGVMLRLGELLGLGDLARFDAEVDALESSTIEHHEPTGRYQILLHRTTRALAAGELTRAERLAEQAVALGRRAEITGAFELFAATLTVLRREQGRLGELYALQPSLFVGHPSPAARVLELWAFAEVGDEASARERLAGVLDETLPTLAAQPTGVANAALLARVSFLLGEPGTAEALATLLEPYAERVVLRGTLTAHGPASHYLALLAWLRGREEEVGARFEHARAFCRRMGAAGWGAQVDCDAALWRAERGDTPGAHELAGRAARVARSLDMAALAPRAESLRDRTA